jgi:hypothetical protein
MVRHQKLAFKSDEFAVSSHSSVLGGLYSIGVLHTWLSASLSKHFRPSSWLEHASSLPEMGTCKRNAFSPKHSCPGHNSNVGRRHHNLRHRSQDSPSQRQGVSRAFHHQKENSHKALCRSDVSGFMEGKAWLQTSSSKHEA